MNCFRFFDFKSMDQVLALDMKEYRLLCEAQRLRNIDREYWLHREAFANNQAALRDRKGRLIYREFKKFFDYEKALGKDEPEESEAPLAQSYLDYLRKKKKESEEIDE